MKLKILSEIETPYTGINKDDYIQEKRNLQIALLEIQKNIIESGSRVAILFEGRDAAGKGSTIKRFTENLIPSLTKTDEVHTGNGARTVALGKPTKKESKHWFKRYEKNFPLKGEIVFFDRSWYSRALIEPTMGYCSKKRYKYFMSKVLGWEKKHAKKGLIIIKFYLSINKETQLFRFDERRNDPLTHWKFSENDMNSRDKWEIFSKYKQQMIDHSSSKHLPWNVINSNKREARLTCLLHVIRLLGNITFEPMEIK